MTETETEYQDQAQQLVTVARGKENMPECNAACIAICKFTHVKHEVKLVTDDV